MESWAASTCWPKICQGASPARYISHSIREDLQGIDVLLADERRTKRGIPSWWPMSVSTMKRSRNGCYPGYNHTDMPPGFFITPYHEKNPHLHDYHDMISSEFPLSWWITGTTRLPPARTETAHAFSGHRSSGRWQRPTTDPYHHMINVNVNVKTILISIWYRYSPCLYHPKCHSWFRYLMCIPSSPAKAPNTPGADHLAALRLASKLPGKLEIVKTTIFCWSKCNLLGE